MVSTTFITTIAIHMNVWVLQQEAQVSYSAVPAEKNSSLPGVMLLFCRQVRGTVVQSFPGISCVLGLTPARKNMIQNLARKKSIQRLQHEYKNYLSLLLILFLEK